MIILKYFLTVLGLFEIISNAIHLSKGTISSIGKSAKRQHQEIPLDLPDQHFFIKAIIMLAFGLLMLISGILILFSIRNYYIITGICVFSFGIYGLIQAIMYRKNIRVWPAVIVYSIPLMLMLFI